MGKNLDIGGRGIFQGTIQVFPFQLPGFLRLSTILWEE